MSNNFKIAASIAVLSLAAVVGEADASSISQHSIQQYGVSESFDISSYGQMDWVIVGVNEKATGVIISTIGSGASTTLMSSVPGGTSLYFEPILLTYTLFTYADGLFPASSAPAPGDQSGYQYDRPAVDFILPAGTTRVTLWLGVGYVDGTTYEATLSDGTTTGAVNYWAGQATRYLLQLDVYSDVAQTLRFSLDHLPAPDPYYYNSGIFAAAVQPVPLPAGLFMFVPGAAILLAFGRNRGKAAS